MSLVRLHQSSFLKGELDPNLHGRTDLDAYGDGLKTAKNVIPLNQGGIERRAGTLFLADLGAHSRIEEFTFSAEQEYIMAFQDTVLKIYSDLGVLLQTITSCPWDTDDLFEFHTAQSGDTILVVDTHFAPQVITRTSATTFTLATFAFDTSLNGEKTYQPYFKFANESITLDINSVTKGATGVTCTTSSAFWTSAYVGQIIRYQGIELLITGYTSTTVVTATLLGKVLVTLDDDPFQSTQGSGIVTVTQVDHGYVTGASVIIDSVEDIFTTTGAGLAFANMEGTFSVTVIDDDHWSFTASSGDVGEDSRDGGGVSVTISGHPATRNWDEQVLSSVNGYPQTCCFHEDRLYFAGSTALPDGIQASKVGYFFNFDVGTALDDEAIQVQISSDHINEIRHLVPTRNVEIFTSTGEFFIKTAINTPVTPSGIRIISQSSYGSKIYPKPKPFDGATVWVQNNGKNVREFLFQESVEGYTGNSVSLLSSHLIEDPVDSAVVTSMHGRTEQFYYQCGDDGHMAVFLSQRAEKIAGWVQWETDGKFDSVATTLTSAYVATERILPKDYSSAVTVTDYANIAVGTTTVFTLNDGTVINLISEASGAGSPTTPSAPNYYYRPFTNNNTTADNIQAVLNAISGLTVANPSANILSVVRDTDGTNNLSVTTTDTTRVTVADFVGTSVHYLEQFADSAFDLPTDCSVSKTLSTSYQPHGTPLVKGGFGPLATFTADGFTNAPSQGETFKFNDNGDTYTISSATYVSTGEYTISLTANAVELDNAPMIFITSKVFTGLGVLEGKTAWATAGSLEGGEVHYYGKGTVAGTGVVIIQSPTNSADFGLQFDMEIETLRKDATIDGGSLTHMPRKIGVTIVDMVNSYHLKVSGSDVIIPTVQINTTTGLEGFTGTKRVHVLGYNTEPHVTVTQDYPLPLRIVGITSEIYY